MSMTVTFNPFEPGYIEDPYPALRRIREADPVHQSPMGFWLLTRYDDVNRTMRDMDRMSVDDRNAPRRMLEDIDSDVHDVILFRDPPNHTRWRKLLAKAFTPATVEASRPRVRQLIDEMLDKAAESDEMEYVSALAFPLPFVVINDLLAMPEADRDQILAWSTHIVKITEPMIGVDVMQEISRCTEEMSAYLHALLAERRRAPGDDVLSHMALAEEDGDRLSDDEIVDHVMLLITAAHEPTVNFLGNGLLALLRDPVQRELLRGDPSLDTNATEELLRYDAPFQLAVRFALTDVEVDDHHIPAGSIIGMSVASANHDPLRWGPTSEELDLRRPRAHEHLAFSRGAHTCFGAALARVQGQEVFGPLLRRFPKVALAGVPRWNGRLNARGLEHLPLTLR